MPAVGAITPRSSSKARRSPGLPLIRAETRFWPTSAGEAAPAPLS